MNFKCNARVLENEAWQIDNCSKQLTQARRNRESTLTRDCCNRTRIRKIDSIARMQVQFGKREMHSCPMRKKI